jgi:predicted lipoprotein
MKYLRNFFLALLVLLLVCPISPLFHIISLKRARQEEAAAMFDPTQFAKKFWRERLLPSLNRAVSCEVLLPAIRNNAADARKTFSHSVGIGDSYTYFVTGQGRVLSVSDDEIALAVTDGATAPEIVLPLGPVFGNAIRDGTGLLNVNDYPNSQDFNGISQALNHLVEIDVLPELHTQAKVGSIVRFTGCAEVNDESSDLKPLRVIPIQAEVQ